MIIDKKRIIIIFSYILLLILLITSNDIFANKFLSSSDLDSLSDLDYLLYLLVKNMVYLFISLLMFFASIIMLYVVTYYYFIKENNKVFIAFAFYFLTASTWILIQNEVVLFVLKNFDLFYLNYFLILLMSFSILFISYYINKATKIKILNICSVIVFFFIAILTCVLHFNNYEHLDAFYEWSILANTFYLLLLTYVTKLTYSQIEKRFTKFFLYLLVLTIVGFIFEYINISLLATFYNGIFLAMICSILLCYITRFIIKEYVKRENYRTYLSEENARLSSSLLLSQIKPHFLYNVLNSISFLCKKDPVEADNAIVNFSKYLRKNMQNIEEKELVEFNDEVEHIKNYLYLQSLRFPKMEIITNFKFTQFKVPTLCIQPIVENAVKHGISKNIGGGTLSMKTYLKGEFVYVEIKDDGPGFEFNIKGTGLTNISRRLKMLIDGEIDFDSKVGVGTTVVVKIPREAMK